MDKDLRKKAGRRAEPFPHDNRFSLQHFIYTGVHFPEHLRTKNGYLLPIDATTQNKDREILPLRLTSLWRIENEAH